MKKVKEIYYIDNRKERASDFSTGFLFVLEDGSKVETMTTDVIAERYTNEKDNKLTKQQVLANPKEIEEEVSKTLDKAFKLGGIGALTHLMERVEGIGKEMENVQISYDSSIDITNLPVGLTAEMTGFNKGWKSASEQIRTLLLEEISNLASREGKYGKNQLWLQRLITKAYTLGKKETLTHLMEEVDKIIEENDDGMWYGREYYENIKTLLLEEISNLASREGK